MTLIIDGTMITEAPVPSAPTAEPGVLVWIGHLLNQAAHRIRVSTAEALAPLGITPPSIRLLEALSSGPTPTQARLGQSIQMDRTTVVHMVDKLEASGLVRRTSDPADRRSHLIALTELGAAVLAEARDEARAAEQAFLAPLSAEQRTQLQTLLQILHQPSSCPEESPR